MEHLIPQALRALLGHGLQPGLAWQEGPGAPTWAGGEAESGGVPEH